MTKQDSTLEKVDELLEDIETEDDLNNHSPPKSIGSPNKTANKGDKADTQTKKGCGKHYKRKEELWVNCGDKYGNLCLECKMEKNDE